MIANKNMMLDAMMNAFADALARQKYRTSLTYGIDHIQQVDDYTYEASILLTKIESLEFKTILPTEGDFIVNDTVRRGLEKANYELVADVNAEGTFPKIHVVVACQPHTPKTFKVINATRDNINLSDLIILTHTHALGGATYPELARVEVEKTIQKLSQDAILKSLENAWSAETLNGLVFTAAGNIHIDARFAKDITVAKKVIAHYRKALLQAADHLSTLETVLPVKVLSEDGDNEMTVTSISAILDDIIDLFDQFGTDLSECKGFLVRYAPNRFKQTLGLSVIGLLSDAVGAANTWGMRLESYEEEVTTKGLSKREQSEGYAAHREIVAKSISTILVSIAGPLEAAHRCLNVIEVE